MTLMIESLRRFGSCSGAFLRLTKLKGKMLEQVGPSSQTISEATPDVASGAVLTGG